MKTLTVLAILLLAPLMAAQSANLSAGLGNPGNGLVAQGAQDHLALEFTFMPTVTSTTAPVLNFIVVQNANVASSMSTHLSELKLWRIDTSTGQPVHISTSSIASSPALGSSAAYFTSLNTPADTTFQVTISVPATTAAGEWFMLRVERTMINCSSGTIGGATLVQAGHQTVATATPPAFTSTTLPQSTQGLDYAQPVQATGGNPPYAFSAAGLPQGWAMAADGELSFAAADAVAGDYNFDVTVTDAANLSDTQTVSLTVNPAPLLNLAANSGVPGQDYTWQFTATGGTGALAFSAIGLPTGWSLDATGLLQVPAFNALEGTHTFDLAVQDALGVVDSASAQITLQVEPSEPNKKKVAEGGACSARGNAAWILPLLPLLALLRRRARC